MAEKTSTNHNVVGFLNPDQVIGEMKIEPGMKIADFGCGTGHFAFELAKKIGPEGSVYAIDVLTTALESIRSQAKMKGLYNIETIRANLEIPGASKLADNSCDLALMANILFQSQKKSEIIGEAKRILKPGGTMVFIEWKPDSPIGPPSEGYKVTPEEITKLSKNQGLIFDRQFEAGSHHYGLIFRRLDTIE